MNDSSLDFTLVVESTSKSCPSGEKWAEEHISKKAIPVLSCEGPCVRGDIARLAANLVSKEEPYARACYAETALVPHSAMATWVAQANKIVIVDGCFLRCMGRLMTNIPKAGKVVHIDALPLHKRFAKVFHMDDVPEAERQEVAQLTADKIRAMLGSENGGGEGGSCSCSE